MDAGLFETGYRTRSPGSRLLPAYLLPLLVFACAGERPEAQAPLISVEAERARAQPPRGPRQLERDEVDRAVKAGLGAFLRHVSVEVSLVDGRFQGFRIVELRPRAAWEGVDLRVGDVVTRINGQSIERPEQAHGVFVGLRQADRVEVSYLRRGEPGQLVVPIVDSAERAAPADSGNLPRDL